MSQVFTLPPLTVVVAMCGLAMLVGGYLVISPGPVRLSLARRRPGAEPGWLLQQATTTVTQAIARLLFGGAEPSGPARSPWSSPA